MTTRWIFVALAAVLAVGAFVDVHANDEGKALYVGGSSKEFPAGGLASRLLDDLARNRFRKLEGSVTTDSASGLVFDAGKDGRLAISYRDVTKLTFGRESRCPKGCMVLIGWDPLDQYTDKAHYLLSITYSDSAGSEQGLVLEPSTRIRQRMLTDLEKRTGLAIEFGDGEACLIHRPAESCGYGASTELRGLSRIYIDAASDEDRTEMLEALGKARLNVAFAANAEAAEVVLSFRGEGFRWPDHLQTLYGGRGTVRVVRGGQPRTVVSYSGTRLRPFGAKPAEKFIEEFVKAFRSANR